MRCVWIVNQYAQVPSGPGGTRHYSLAKHLLSKGWSSFVIAGSFEHNTGRQRLGVGERRRIECSGKVNFLWIKVTSYPLKSTWRRLISMSCFALSVLKKSSIRALPKPDIVIGSTVHPFAAFSACLLARRYCVPFVFEVRDLWPTTLVALGVIRSGGLLNRLLAWLELWIANRAACIIVVMPGGIDYYQNLGIPRHRLLWLPNGAELFDSQPVSPCLQPRPFQLLYCGAHGPANSLETVLDAMLILQNRGVGPNDLVLRLIGDGKDKVYLKQRAEDLGLSLVRFEPPVPKQVLASLLSEADGFVVAMQRLPELYRYGISFNKLFDYFQAARPIVSASCAAYDPVLEADAGFVVPAGDPFALAEAIDKLRHLPHEERERFGLNGRAYFQENHSYAILAKRLALCLSHLVSSR